MFSQEHLKFKGVPIDGSLESFTDSMKNVGYDFLKAGDGYCEYKGDFIGNDATISAHVSTTLHSVYQVLVTFGEKESWTSLLTMYNKVKDLYVKKYGEPVKNVHHFTKPYYEGDGYELSALRKGKCIYGCSWKVELGQIVLVMSPPACVVLAYVDGYNAIMESLESEKSNLEEI